MGDCDSIVGSCLKYRGFGSNVQRGAKVAWTYLRGALKLNEDVCMMVAVELVLRAVGTVARRRTGFGNCVCCGGCGLAIPWVRSGSVQYSTLHSTPFVKCSSRLWGARGCGELIRWTRTRKGVALATVCSRGCILGRSELLSSVVAQISSGNLTVLEFPPVNMVSQACVTSARA